jgi:hypothetical protein
MDRRHARRRRARGPAAFTLLAEIVVRRHPDLVAVPEPHPLVGKLPPSIERRSYAAVRDAWKESLEVCEPKHEPLAVALRSFAREARAHAVTPAVLLTALDAIVRPSMGGDSSLDWDHVREWAGMIAIRAYYQDD